MTDQTAGSAHNNLCYFTSFIYCSLLSHFGSSCHHLNFVTTQSNGGVESTKYKCSCK